MYDCGRLSGHTTVWDTKHSRQNELNWDIAAFNRELKSCQRVRSITRVLSYCSPSTGPWMSRCSTVAMEQAVVAGSRRAECLARDLANVAYVEHRIGYRIAS